MIIRKYGLLLREVEREDLEMIRQYRNSDVIKSKMLYRQLISREQQKAWFKEISKPGCSYFIIYKDDVALGLINGKKVDIEKKTSEGGIFIWDKDCSYETIVLSSIIINDWGFLFNDVAVNNAEVLKENKKAIGYNKVMGYRISEEIHPNPEALWMTQTKEDYLKFRKKLSALKIEGQDISDLLRAEDLSIEDAEVESKMKEIAKLNEPLKSMYLKMMKQR